MVFVALEKPPRWIHLGGPPSAELAAAREADFAYRFAFNAVCASAEIKSPALRHARSSTVVRIIRQAFEEKIAGRA